jgi:nicotinamidase/pyrazinamidase
VTVRLDLTAGVAAASTAAAVERMRQAGIALVGEPVVRAAAPHPPAEQPRRG